MGMEVLVAAGVGLVFPLIPELRAVGRAQATTPSHAEPRGRAKKQKRQALGHPSVHSRTPSLQHGTGTSRRRNSSSAIGSQETQAVRRLTRPHQGSHTTQCHPRPHRGSSSASPIIPGRIQQRWSRGSTAQSSRWADSNCARAPLSALQSQAAPRTRSSSRQLQDHPLAVQPLWDFHRRSHSARRTASLNFRPGLHLVQRPCFQRRNQSGLEHHSSMAPLPTKHTGVRHHRPPLDRLPTALPCQTTASASQYSYSC